MKKSQLLVGLRKLSLSRGPVCGAPSGAGLQPSQGIWPGAQALGHATTGLRMGSQRGAVSRTGPRAPPRLGTSTGSRPSSWGDSWGRVLAGQEVTCSQERETPQRWRHGSPTVPGTTCYVAPFMLENVRVLKVVLNSEELAGRVAPLVTASSCT